MHVMPVLLPNWKRVRLAQSRQWHREFRQGSSSTAPSHALARIVLSEIGVTYWSRCFKGILLFGV